MTAEEAIQAAFVRANDAALYPTQRKCVVMLDGKGQYTVGDHPWSVFRYTLIKSGDTLEKVAKKVALLSKPLVYKS